MTRIKFGTDGWRAIIGKDFTAENVARLIQAFCDIERPARNRLVYVGYDRRLDSDKMARLVATLLAANEFSVRLSKQFCPTPCISWLVKTHQAFMGIIITASHNPSEWNGIKFKDAQGGSVSTTYTSRIEEAMPFVQKKIEGHFEDFLSRRVIQYFDPYGEYVDHLKNFFNIGLIQQRAFQIVVDPLYGAGTGFVKRVLGGPGLVEIHHQADPGFGGLNPEPIEKNLSVLKETVLKNAATLGLATDGDADRIGACDEQGRFVSPHQIFALLLLHYVRHRKLRGAVVRSVSTTGLIDRICAKEGLPLIETPIGFKHIVSKLIEHDALMGGEESGGISLREHVHERDGIFNGLALLEMMAVQNKGLSQLIRDMDDEFGRLYFERRDEHLTIETIAQIQQRISKQDIKDVGGIPVTGYNMMDGCKMCFEDGSWLLVRASGTEPVLRMYAEAASEQRVRALLDFMNGLKGNC